MLEQLTLILKVTPLEQLPVALSDVLVKRCGGLLVHQTREGHRILVKQWLQSQVSSSAVVQHKQQVSCIGQHVAGAEGATSLCGVVGGRQGLGVLEQVKQGEQWQQGLGVANLHGHSFTHLLARSDIQDRRHHSQN